MSGHKLTRNQRLMGRIGAAAVVATLSGVPQELAHWFAGDHDTSSMAVAGKPPKGPPPPPRPPPPPAVPLPQPLNVDPNTIWFADWHVNETATAPANFFATPSNYLTVPFQMSQMNASAAAGHPLGIKIENSLTAAQGQALFNTKYAPGDQAISYVFADIEVGTRPQVQSKVTALVAQVRLSQWSKNAYVGQWELTPLNPEDDRMGRNPPLPPGGQIGSAHRRWGRMEYNAMKVNMANTQLYPGAGDFRNTSTNDWANQNIRTGLFIGPIGRMTQVQSILDQSYNGLKTETGLNNHKQIPWIARFNNFGNRALDNADLPGLDYVFEPGTALPQAGLSADQTRDQMLGRGDVGAMTRHYRMRGAYSVNLFESGVVGYTQQQFQDDVREAWTGDAKLNNIMAQADNKYATMTLSPHVDNSSMGGNRAEETGTIWSGQYSLDIPNPNSDKGRGNPADRNKGEMAILASNLDTVDHLIRFGAGDTPYEMYLWKNADGYTWDDGSDTASSRNALIEAGMHKMLIFDLKETRIYKSLADVGSNRANTYTTKTVWLWNNSYGVFGNNEGRNDRGIPEPTTFGSLAAAGAIAVVCRRQRRKA
jgi:hypothetical protein